MAVFRLIAGACAGTATGGVAIRALLAAVADAVAVPLAAVFAAPTGRVLGIAPIPPTVWIVVRVTLVFRLSIKQQPVEQHITQFKVKVGTQLVPLFVAAIVPKVQPLDDPGVVHRLGQHANKNATGNSLMNPPTVIIMEASDADKLGILSTTIFASQLGKASDGFNSTIDGLPFTTLVVVDCVSLQPQPPLGNW